MKLTISITVLFISFFSLVGMGQTDDFSEFDKKTEITTNENDTSLTSDEFSDSEFSDVSNEFEETSGGEFSEFTETEPEHRTNWNRFNWAIGILVATFIAGIFVRHEKTRKFRPLFLLAAVVILGFYRGGPGIISSFQNFVLVAIGQYWKWTAAVLFVGVIILTYFQGRVFCGWICYLGAIQDFLYISKVKILQTEKAQKIMRTIRYILLSVLVIQLIITQTIEWSKIGPFKVIFNLYSPNITGYILLGMLLISSLFIYRPFCKMVCPVGLILGLVTKIPGASVLGITNSCTGCKICNTSCNINAITRDGKVSKLDNQECIMCGECMNDCRIKSIKPFRKNNIHKGQITLKGIKKVEIN